MNSLKVVFFGCTNFSKKTLLSLIKNKIQFPAAFPVFEDKKVILYDVEIIEKRENK